jgi:hypothetical protein
MLGLISILFFIQLRQLASGAGAPVSFIALVRCRKGDRGTPA